jgi:hypothetical protein
MATSPSRRPRRSSADGICWVLVAAPPSYRPQHMHFLPDENGPQVYASVQLREHIALAGNGQKVHSKWQASALELRNNTPN